MTHDPTFHFMIIDGTSAYVGTNFIHHNNKSILLGDPAEANANVAKNIDMSEGRSGASFRLIRAPSMLSGTLARPLYIAFVSLSWYTCRCSFF